MKNFFFCEIIDDFTYLILRNSFLFFFHNFSIVCYILYLSFYQLLPGRTSEKGGELSVRCFLAQVFKRPHLCFSACAWWDPVLFSRRFQGKALICQRRGSVGPAGAPSLCRAACPSKDASGDPIFFDGLARSHDILGFASGVSGGRGGRLAPR